MLKRHIVIANVVIALLGVWPAGIEAATLRVALGGFEEDNFDPKFSGGTTIMRVSAQIYDYLTWLNPKFEVVPGLAERWDVSPDGRTYTFHLRRGVKFHNGDPVTSEDVKFSVTRQMDKDSKNSIAGALRGILESVEAPSPSIVVMRLKSADPDLLLNLSPYVGGTPIVPAAYMNRVGVDAFARDPIGSGPWKLVKHEPGARIEYEAVPGHWRAEPRFDRLVLLAIPEESSRVAMLERGEADIAEISVGREAELRARQLTVTTIPRVMQIGVFMYGTWVDPKAPLADIRVRKALASAVDADAIVKGVLLGQGERALPWGIFPGAAYADANRPSQRPITYNPEKARSLLREAGYPRGFDLRLYSITLSGASVLTKVAEVVASNWKQVGVNVQIVPIEFGALRSMYRGRDPKLNRTVTVHRYPAVFDAAFNCQDRGVVRTASSQPLHNSNKIDELCEAAVKEPDPKVRAEKMKRVFDVLDDEVFFGFTIAYGNALYGSNPKTVAGWTPIQSYIDLGPVYERMQPAN